MALPALFSGNRRADAVLLPLFGIGQAAALGVSAFATRAAFEALHTGARPAWATLATLVSAGIAAAGIELFARRRAEALGQSYASALRQRLYAHLAGLSRTELSGRRLGALSLRFVGDLSAARAWFGRGVPDLISAGAVLPGAAAVLWLLDPALAWAALPAMGLTLALMATLAAGLSGRHKRLRSSRASVAISMMERIAISPDLDLMNRTDRELDRLETAGAALRRRAMDRATRSGAIRFLPQAGAALAGAAMFHAAATAGLAPASVAAGLAVLAILTLPLRKLADCADRYWAWRVARGRAHALLAIPSVPRRILPAGAPVSVTIEGVAVGESRVDAHVPAGAFARITGPTGAGKSRLAAMIAGLDRPGTGRLIHGGRSDTLPRIAQIDDRPVVIQGSLRRALTMGLHPRPRRRRIEEVARAFGLGGLIARIGGIGGRLGEGGRTVSQGEALRIALARAALTAPDLAVIDSDRLHVDPAAGTLISSLRAHTCATIILTDPDGAGAEEGAITLPSAAAPAA